MRKRPGMYIGSTGPSGLHHLVYEIVDNSIDEALAGYCTHIEVTIKPGNIIEVSDNGRGIPVDIQPKLGIPAVTVVYTVLHAGGKFGGEDSGYKVAGGLHGVGASVVNALSEWLIVHVRRDGAEYEQSFKRGKPDGDLKKIGVAASTGTTVTFKPDPEMFTETTEYDYEILLKRLREESFLNAGVRITLTDERPESIEKNDGVPPQESMCYEGGVRSFVQYLHEKRDLTPLHPQVIYMKGEANGAVAEVALQYCDSYNELILSFANNVHTPEGGTHEEGLKTALTRVFNEFGRAKGYLKGNYKTEEVFGLLRRSTGPTTVYKKQELDRDDVVDITSFDVVAWLRNEMRYKLNRELALAYILGDGRMAASRDKIDENCIRPVFNDADLFTIKVQVKTTGLSTVEDKYKAFIKQAIRARKDYRGSGTPTMFTTEDALTEMLLLEDGMGRPLYTDEAALARKLRVAKIVTIPEMEGRKGAKGGDLAAVIVNLADYTVGADKGGAVSMFDDFDIDFNAQKYLIETRCSGAMTTPYGAMTSPYSAMAIEWAA